MAEEIPYVAMTGKELVEAYVEQLSENARLKKTINILEEEVEHFRKLYLEVVRK